MSDTFLSIIIPCYNVAEYLPKTIQSLEQLHNANDIEFIFINDGSPDNSLGMIQSFQARDERVKLIDQVNSGVSAARNNAIEIAKGEYLTLLDGDDYLAPEAINIIRNNMTGCDIMLPEITREKDGKQTYCHNNIAQKVYSIDDFFSLIKVFPTAPQLIYKTSIIQEHGLKFDTVLKCGEVYDFTIRFMLHAQNITVVNKSFYYYVMRPSSAVHKPNFEADLSILHLLSNCNSIDKKKNHWAESSAFPTTAFRLATSFTYNKYIHSALVSDKALSTIKKVLCDKTYSELLSQTIWNRNVPIKIRLLAMYIKLMPVAFGYYLLSTLSLIKKKL